LGSVEKRNRINNNFLICQHFYVVSQLNHLWRTSPLLCLKMDRNKRQRERSQGTGDTETGIAAFGEGRSIRQEPDLFLEPRKCTLRVRTRSNEVVETYSFLENKVAWLQELFTNFASAESTPVQSVGLRYSPYNNKTCSADENTETKSCIANFCYMQ